MEPQFSRIGPIRTKCFTWKTWGRTWRQHLHQGSDAGGARTHQETPREPTDRGSLSHPTLKAILWNFSHSFPVTMSPGLLPDSIIFHLFCHFFKDSTISACPFKVGTLKCPCAFCRCFSPTRSVISPDWIPNNYFSIIYSHHSKSFRFPETQLVQNWRLFPQTCYFHQEQVTVISFDTQSITNTR